MVWIPRGPQLSLHRQEDGRGPAATHDLKTALAGNIARALAVFCVDEVVVFDDGHVVKSQQNPQVAAVDKESGYTAFSDPNHFLYHVLSYLETPPHLRRALFPHHPNLRTAGALNSLDMPHHMRADEWCQYREGVTTADLAPTESEGLSGGAQPSKKRKKHNTPSSETPAFVLTLVNAGLPGPVKVPIQIPANTRVTLKFPSASPPPSLYDMKAEPVSPDAPRVEAGYYWGYTTRLAPSLSAVFTECPYEDGYDFSIGTSERGGPLRELLSRCMSAGGGEDEDAEQEEDEVENIGAGKIPNWQHLLIVFGGLAGLEKAVASDEQLREKDVTQASELFDAWVNLVEGQGSRTIRTEEAVWIGLMGLRELIRANDRR